jgi:hypothetical protein
MRIPLFCSARRAFYHVAPLTAALFAVANGVAGAGPTHQSPGPRTLEAGAELPSWLLGVWSRDWIAKRGVKSNTLDVHYLQAPAFFADVRFPRDRPELRHAMSFADLTDEELRLLARQRGFAGRTTVAGAIATWHHEIDFQPPDGTDDIGRLEPTVGVGMYEHALDDSYLESWRFVTGGEGRFLVIRIQRAGRLDRMLLVAGDYFLYVRNRAKDLPVAESLEALIDSKRASRSQIIEYLDCEFSAGKVRGGVVTWEIQHSTLPWQEGRHLELVDRIAVSRGGAGLVPKIATAERWTIPVNTFASGELSALFGAAAESER